MSKQAIEAVIELIELGAMANNEDIVQCLRSAMSAQQALPDVLTKGYGYNAQYIEGWNECREVMKGMMK